MGAAIVVVTCTRARDAKRIVKIERMMNIGDVGSNAKVAWIVCKVVSCKWETSSKDFVDWEAVL
jgi:maleate cis-trans isomerase